jgi:hypothetical protein
VDNIKRVYPGMTAAQQRGWEQFFETVRDVKAQLSVAQLDLSNGTADAQVTGTYTYLNNSTRTTERLPVSFHATLRALTFPKSCTPAPRSRSRWV